MRWWLWVVWPLALVALVVLWIGSWMEALAGFLFEPGNRVATLIVLCWAGMLVAPVFGFHFVAGIVTILGLWMAGLTHG